MARKITDIVDPTGLQAHITHEIDYLRAYRRHLRLRLRDTSERLRDLQVLLRASKRVITQRIEDLKKGS